MTDDAKTMLIREFEFALRLAWLEETERMRNVIYGYQLLRDGMAELLAEMREMRREDAAASAHYPAAPNK
jgi:hypothetical protein